MLRCDFGGLQTGKSSKGFKEPSGCEMSALTDTEERGDSVDPYL